MKFQKILMLDNFDSFTYNIVDYFKVLGCEVDVYRNTVAAKELENKDFDLLVLSPGPSIPRNAGNMFDVIAKFHQTKPIFGICLGHQALIEFFGGSLKYLYPRHGKADTIIHDGKTIYSGLRETIEIARYHSLGGEIIPSVLDVSARSQDGTVMSVRHKSLPIEGVQYHPESVLSMREEVGMRLMRNVVNGVFASSNLGYLDMMRLLSSPEALTYEHLQQFVEDIKNDRYGEDQKLILLVALSFKLQNPVYCARFIEILQAQSNFVGSSALGQQGIDICGTGGSGLPRINTSTLSALALSALNVPILKHGNRASSGRFGSFNLLESLEIPFPLPMEKTEKGFKESNLAFLFAPSIHPVVGKFGSARLRVGAPTVFNTLGPLLNPYSPVRQFIGTPFAEYHDLIFETGILLGKSHLAVARGEDGLDEISVSAPTRIKIYKEGQRSEVVLRPEDFGIETIPFERVKSENQQENIAIAHRMMEGHLDGDHHKLVAVNAAFVLSEFQEKISLREAYQKVLQSMQAGAMGKQLSKYKKTIGA